MNNTIQSIAPLWDQLERPVQKTGASPTGLFGDLLQSAVDAVRQTESEKNQTAYLLATGQLDNPALLTIAGTKAELSVELLVQLRNKALDAYNELMRISL